MTDEERAQRLRIRLGACAVLIKRDGGDRDFPIDAADCALLLRALQALDGQRCPPREPTKAMLKAAWDIQMILHAGNFYMEDAEKIYRAMYDEWLSSLPPPPTRSNL